MGISAGSYSRNAAAGIKGKWIAETNTIEIAPSMAMDTSCLVEIFLFIVMYLRFCLGYFILFHKKKPEESSG